jgi:integrase/recombinase XerD
MILLGYLHGLRAHEIAKVHSGDFDVEAGILTVVGKGGVERLLPIHAALALEIPSMPAHGYWFPARGGREGHIHWKAVSDLMTKAKRRAGITEKRKTGHSLRHAFGTQLVRSGADLRTTQELMGHASLATTQIYIEVDRDRMTAAAAALPMPVIPIHSGRRRAA